LARSRKSRKPSAPQSPPPADEPSTPEASEVPLRPEKIVDLPALLSDLLPPLLVQLVQLGGDLYLDHDVRGRRGVARGARRSVGSARIDPEAPSTARYNAAPWMPTVV
jgi:hypothetical protein